MGFVARGAVEESSDGHHVSFNIEPDSTLQIDATGKAFRGIIGGRIQTSGAFLLDKSGDRVVIGNLALVADKSGAYRVLSTLDAERGEYASFGLLSVMVDFVAATQELSIIGDLLVNEAWAMESGIHEAAGVEIGSLRVDGVAMPASPEDVVEAGPTFEELAVPRGGVASASGPDVIVADLQTVQYYGHGSGDYEDIHAYAIGTHACNLGDVRASWVSYTNQHPVIVQNMYRLKDNRFEQIGMSWVKHGFYAVSWNFCGYWPDGCEDPTDGSALGVGCSDPYAASLNGVQSNMSRRSDVNAFTGYFPYPWTAPDPEPTVGKRLQVHESDLDPDLNPGASYFLQGHYVTPGDALVGNHFNNASYRPASLSKPSTHEFVVTPSGQTHREQPAVRAWQDNDPDVVETDLQIPGEGLLILAAKAVDLGTGEYRYSYALQNLNSDRAAGSFSVPLPDGAVLSNITFHDVDYHSGEVYSNEDWLGVEGDGVLTWSTETYAENPNANALRFSTLYSFYFDANVEPASTTITVGLFKPGSPTEVTGVSIGPKLALIDCNRNGIADQCDVDCNADGCEPPCGGSIDCNDNVVPDECEPDCNGNDIADECDIQDCDESLWCQDCNSNTVPDGCEADCDGNGIPDDCVPPADTDGDGLDDCSDLCPLTTPGAVCYCPPSGECCWNNGSYCLQDYPLDLCVTQNGVPDCLADPCRQGCLIGDFDDDGDLDMRDFAVMQIGFSGSKDWVQYEEPIQDYWLKFDFDEDIDIDLSDYGIYTDHMSSPR